MSKIKLLKIGELPNGTIRLQSQLYMGRDAVDFIIADGVLKHWDRGERGFDFYEYKEPYEIVEDREDMREQEL